MQRQPRLPLRLFTARFPQSSVPNSHRGFAKIYQPAIKGRYIAGYASAAVVIGTVLGWCVTDKRNPTPRFEDRPGQYIVTETDPSKTEVTRLLTDEAYSLTAKNIPGVERFDGARLAANSPCEDRYTHEIVYPWEDGKPWVALALFDGHCGWQTADFLEKNLIEAVRQSLGRIPLPSNGEGIPEQAVHEAIMKAFNDLDNAIIKGAEDAAKSNLPLQEKVRKFDPAFAGSCALLSLYDPTTGRLHVACTGDSRAILGQLNKDGKWETVALSADQNADNVDEAARLKKEHPGEDGITKDGRVFGLAVSRAFGDGRWKWPSDLMKDFFIRFSGLDCLPTCYNVRTPPYLIAEPVVTTTLIEPGRPSFLIAATDGISSYVSREEAVDLVAAWLNSGPCYSEEESKHYAPFDFGAFWEGERQDFVKEREVVKDDNAAVHLMRNSLGGNHSELIAGRLAFTPPHARNRRDDITIQVVFFNGSIAQKDG